MTPAGPRRPRGSPSVAYTNLCTGILLLTARHLPNWPSHSLWRRFCRPGHGRNTLHDPAGARLAKASRRLTNSLPCSAARLVMLRILRCSSSSAARLSSRPRPPITAASKLLKSCAMPPVSLPIASIFWAWINWFSSDRCSVISVSVPANSTGRPSVSFRRTA